MKPTIPLPCVHLQHNNVVVTAIPQRRHNLISKLRKMAPFQKADWKRGKLREKNKALLVTTTELEFEQQTTRLRATFRQVRSNIAQRAQDVSLRHPQRKRKLIEVNVTDGDDLQVRSL